MTSWVEHKKFDNLEARPKENVYPADISYYVEDVDPEQPDHHCHVDENVDPANIISPHFQFEENNNLPSYKSKDQDTNTSKLKLYKINTFLLNIIGNV